MSITCELDRGKPPAVYLLCELGTLDVERRSEEVMAECDGHSEVWSVFQDETK